VCVRQLCAHLLSGLRPLKARRSKGLLILLLPPLLPLLPLIPLPPLLLQPMRQLTRRRGSSRVSRPELIGRRGRKPYRGCRR